MTSHTQGRQWSTARGQVFIFCVYVAIGSDFSAAAAATGKKKPVKTRRHARLSVRLFFFVGNGWKRREIPPTLATAATSSSATADRP